jgi:hypothetical protein
MAAQRSRSQLGAAAPQFGTRGVVRDDRRSSSRAVLTAHVAGTDDRARPAGSPASRRASARRNAARAGTLGSGSSRPVPAPVAVSLRPHCSSRTAGKIEANRSAARVDVRDRVDRVVVDRHGRSFEARPETFDSRPSVPANGEYRRESYRVRGGSKTLNGLDAPEVRNFGAGLRTARAGVSYSGAICRGTAAP